MHSFLDIKTVFNDTEGRTLNNLSMFYNDIDKLEKSIAKIIDVSSVKDQISGKKILIKPNWVRHSKSSTDEICLRTNDNFVLATLNVILKFSPGQVVIGDAPIQGCNWEKMISKYMISGINGLSVRYNIPVNVKDFRRRIYDVSENKPESGISALSDYLIFDLGMESLLEPVTKPGKTRFRVTNYDPDSMIFAHSPGIHKYCIIREFFNADIVISLPKIKTHQKTGITGALKNLVGINGDKDFLPHHRIGGTRMGGDCYPGLSDMRYWSELSLDKANRLQGRKSFWFWQKLSSLLWSASFPDPEQNLAAGWHGNDTTWRMVCDINRIAEYGKADGTLSANPQRQIFSLCDGIIAGQGDGPLEPQPLPLGILSFTNNSLINDRAMALLMGLPIDKIPLLNNNFITDETECRITIDGEFKMFDELKHYSVFAKPPVGWEKYFNRFQ